LRNGIYQIWGNENATKAACTIVSGGVNPVYCIEEIYRGTLSEEKAVLCTFCQKSFWSSFDFEVGAAPHLYYWTFGDQAAYVDKVRRVCGYKFFE